MENIIKYKVTFTGSGEFYPLKRLIDSKDTVTMDSIVFNVQTPVYGNDKMKYVGHSFNIYELEKEGIVTIEETTV